MHGFSGKYQRQILILDKHLGEIGLVDETKPQDLTVSVPRCHIKHIIVMTRTGGRS